MWCARWCRRSFFFSLLLIVACFVSGRALAAPLRLLEVELGVALSPAQADMLDDALDTARKEHLDSVLLRLDTPGGAISVMRRMVTAMLNSRVPVVVYVAPSGARAASAGVFLMAAATVNAMAPLTTIGSASPVGLGGSDLGAAMQRKITHDLQSQLRAVLALRGRNVDWYLQSVSKAANLTAQEAVSERVVDYLAVDTTDLLLQIGKRGLPARDGLRFFAPAEVTVTSFVPSLRYRLLAWMLEPSVAYFLFMAGLIGLFFELATPGAILPGVVGGICLLLSLYALSVLPTSLAGVLLLLLAGVFFILELHVVSYGLLGLSGLIALVIGSLLLFDTDAITGLSLRTILVTAGGLGLVFVLTIRLLAKAQRLRPRTGLEALVGEQAIVRVWQDASGKVFVHGELWDAATSESEPFRVGQTVEVASVSGMRLWVVSPKQAG